MGMKGRCSGQMVFAGGNRMFSSCFLAPGSVAMQITVTTCGFSWQDQWLINEPEEILALGNICEFRWTSFLPGTRSILLGFREVEEPINCDYFKKRIYMYDKCYEIRQYMSKLLGRTLWFGSLYFFLEGAALWFPLVLGSSIT